MARRSPETIEQDQGDILNQVASIGHHRSFTGRGEEVSEQELRPQRAPYPSPQPPGGDEKHPRRTDLQALVKQGKLEISVKDEWTSHSTSNVGRNYIDTKHTRAYYKVSPAQFEWMMHPEYVPGEHEPVRDRFDAGETDEDMRKDRQQRAEGTRVANENSVKYARAALATRRPMRRAT
jgi:hypothetical protein